MKKAIVSILVAFVSFLLFSCIEIADVTSIELNWTPKVEYVLSDEVLLDNKVVTVNYNDDSSQEYTFSNTSIEKVSGIYESGGHYYLDTRAIGDFVFRIEYEGSLISIQYSVVEGVLEIEVANEAELVSALGGTTPAILIMTDNITLTAERSTTRYMGINTNGFTLTLTGYSVTVNIPSEASARTFDGMSYEMKGTFIGGAINISSIFENSPNIDYDFNINVASTTVFDTVYLVPGSTSADMQIHANLTSTTDVLLLGEGEYSFSCTVGYGVKIYKSLIIIGKTNNLGEPVSILRGNTDSNLYGLVAFYEGNFNGGLYNLHFTDFGNKDPNQNNMAYHGIVTRQPWTGTATLDNIIVENYNRKAISHQGGNLIVANSIIDFGQEVPSGWIAYGIFSGYNATSLSVNNTVFYGHKSESPSWSGGAIVVAFMNEGVTLVISEIKNNTFYGQEYGIAIENNKVNHTQIAMDGMIGNTFINNSVNINLNSNLEAPTEFQFRTSVAGHNAYPAVVTYNDNPYSQSIQMYGNADVTLTSDLTIDHATLLLGHIYSGVSNDATLTINTGVTLTLGEYGSIQINTYEGIPSGYNGTDSTMTGMLNINGTLVHVAYYDLINVPYFTGDNAVFGNQRIYVGHTDLIPNGTTYFELNPDGVTYTERTK